MRDTEKSELRIQKKNDERQLSELRKKFAHIETQIEEAVRKYDISNWKQLWAQKNQLRIKIDALKERMSDKAINYRGVTCYSTLQI
jgi:hypothetical protein